MARVFFTGFDGQHIVADGDAASSTAFSGSGLSYDTSIKRTGSASLKVAAVSGTQGSASTGPFGAYYARFYMRVTARPATTARRFFGSSSAGIVNLLLNPAGTIVFQVAGSPIGTSTTALTDTTKWYRIEVRAVNGSSVPVLLIDGSTEVSGSPSSWNIDAVFGPAGDTVADTYTAYFDDFSLDGAAFPGDGNVVLLVPISDNSVGSGWSKNGATNTANLFSSVDNTPPVGVADASSGTTSAENQIRNPSSAAASYVANMTTYTTAGIGASDTVNAVRAFTFTGAPTSTGAKSGSLQITANPAEGSATSFGNYHSGANAGTFPTGWRRAHNAVVSSPSVTLGNSPTLSLNITGGTASRIADSCFLGIYVDYTPAASSDVTVTPGAASLTTTGSAPAISLPKLVTPTAASLATSASAPAVVLNTIVTPAAASLTTSGSAPTVTATANVTVTPTAASLATSASAPTVATTDHKTVLPSVASLATSASAPTVTATDNKTVTPSSAALTTSASAPTVTVANNIVVTPSAASLTTSASAPAVVTPVIVQPAAGSLATAGSVPVLATGVTPSQVALSTTASAPAVGVSDNQVALPSAASLTTTASAPAIVTPVTVAPSAVALVTTASAPTVVNPVSFEPSAASLTITASAPPLTLPGSVEPAAAALTLTTEAPAVLIPTVLLPVAASLSLTAEAPEVAAPALSEPAAAELTITASEPDVALPVQVAPDAVDLTLTSATPAIAAGGDVHVVPGPLGLTLVGKRPTVKAIHARPRVRAIGSIAGLKRVPHAPQTVKPEPAHLHLLPESPLVTMIDDGDIMQILALIA